MPRKKLSKEDQMELLAMRIIDLLFEAMGNVKRKIADGSISLDRRTLIRLLWFFAFLTADIRSLEFLPPKWQLATAYDIGKELDDRLTELGIQY